MDKTEKIKQVKELLNLGHTPKDISKRLGVNVQYVYKINKGSAGRDIQPFTKRQLSLQQQINDNKTIILNVDPWIKEIILERLEQERARLERSIALAQLKVDALKTGDITYLPAIVIKEWEEKGILVNGKFPEDQDKQEIA